MRDPARGAAGGEDHGEQLGRNADGLEDDARVEVDVRVQVALDEIGIGQGDLFELHGQFQVRIVDAQLAEYFVAGLFHDLGARVEVLVHAMTEAHQLERIILVLGLGDEGFDVGYIANLIQHAQHGFVGATVSRSPQRGDAGGDTGEGVGTGRAGQAHGGSRGVLFVIGVQHEDAVHGAGQHRIDRFDLCRRVEHHVQEVFRVAQLVVGVHQRLTHGILVDHGGDGRHLGDQANGRDFTVLRVVDVQRVVIEGGQGTHHATHDSHRMAVTTEAVEEVLQLLVHHGVVLDGAVEFLLLFRGGQLALEQQIAGFEKV